MYLEYYFEPYGASMQPVYTFGGLSAFACCLALYELYQDCMFQKAAKKGLKGASYVQVGMPVQPGGPAGVPAGTKKDMV